MRARTRCLLAALLVFTAGCDLQDHGNDTVARGVADAGATQSTEARCEIGDLPVAGSTDSMPAPAIESIVGGPAGPRFVTGTMWSEAVARDDAGIRTGVLPARRSPTGWSFAWAGTGYVGFAGREVFALDADLAAPRSVERFGSTVCEAVPLSLTDGAVAVFRQSDNEHCEAGRGALYFQRFARDGSPDGPAILLTRGREHAPVGRIREARIDAGRVVIAIETGGAAAHYLVLSLQGQELLSGDAENVVCPRAGCVRLLGRDDPSLQTETGREDSALLRVELVGRARGFSIPLEVDRVRAVAVRGDRVLLFYQATSSGSSDPGRRIAVVDIARRRVESLVDSTSRAQAGWLDWSVGTPPRMVPSDDGFILAGNDGLSTGRVRAIHCRSR